MRILFVGLGGIGQRHLRNIVALENANNLDLYAYRTKGKQFVLDNRLAIVENKTLEEEYGITRVQSLGEAWRIGMDVVIVCNPTSLHEEIILSAVDNNCNIFIEKPLSHQEGVLPDIKKKIVEKGIVSFVGFQNRYHPCIEKARQLLQTGKLGRVLSVQAEVGESVKLWHPYEDYRIMYACREELGGGVVLSQIHELDYLQWFFGMPSSVYAVGGRLSDLEIDVEDVVQIQAVFNNEDGSEIPTQLHQDYMQNPLSRGCKIIGTQGRVEFSLSKSCFMHYDERGKLLEDLIFEFERNDMFLKEMGIFLNAIKGNSTQSDLIDFSEGMKSMYFALGVKESLRTGKVVKFNKEGAFRAV